VRLHVEARDRVGAELDRQLFQRAVGNLVANALAHTPPGGAVTFTASGDETVVVVEMADTGCGIAAGDLPHVFDRFYWADRSRTSGRGGVGLGLSIVRSIAELHSGMAEVASEAGRGARFRLTFPRVEGPSREEAPEVVSRSR
jgi:two-component system heavy metal sensor histidine kinase CusS